MLTVQARLSAADGLVSWSRLDRSTVMYNYESQPRFGRAGMRWPPAIPFRPAANPNGSAQPTRLAGTYVARPFRLLGSTASQDPFDHGRKL